MNWYIVIVTTVDWYTVFDGVHKIKAKSVQEAIEKVKQLKEYEKYESSWNNYRFIEIVFNCGRREPIED